jgi:ATP-binding cassette subfamily B protein
MQLPERLTRLVRPRTEEGGVVAAAPMLGLREIMRRFWPDARPYRKWIPVAVLLIAISAAIEAAEIWIFMLLVDEVLVPGDLSALPWIAGAFLALTLLAGLVNFGDEYLSDWLGERFLLNLRVRLFSHLQRSSLETLDRRRLGDVLARLIDDVRSIETFVLSGIADGLAAILRILFFCGALFLLDWQLALVALLIVPLFYGVAKRFGRLVKRAAREARRRSGSLGALAEQSLGNLALVQASNRQQDEVERFRDEGEAILDARLTSTRINALFTPVVDLVELVGVMLVVGLGTLAVTEGSLTLGGLLVFITYLTRLYSPVRELGSLSNAFFSAAAGAERVIELQAERPAVVERPGARRIDRARGAIELDGVSFGYRASAQPALEGIDLRIEPGETVALVGPSGAGKSTLARLLLRFYDPDQGAVVLDGHDLRQLELRSLRANVAILMQEALVLHGSVRENIAYARPDATEAEILAAAKAAGADEFVRGLPEGYATLLGERGRRLSGGQRQRIAIARALLADAPVLILDEPSTGLDAAARAELLPPLRELMRGRTTIIISHDLLTVRDADRIVVLEDGRLTAAGTHEELLTTGETYARLWALHEPGQAGEGASPPILGDPVIAHA